MVGVPFKSLGVSIVVREPLSALHQQRLIALKCLREQSRNDQLRADRKPNLLLNCSLIEGA